MIHLLLSVAVPLAIALVFYRPIWAKALLLMLLSMVIDIDHLLADPIYDPNRCSIGFHPLHTLVPIGIYLALWAHERTRLVGLGLCVHVLLDAIDCQMTNGVWYYGGG